MSLKKTFVISEAAPARKVDLDTRYLSQLRGLLSRLDQEVKSKQTDKMGNPSSVVKANTITLYAQEIAKVLRQYSQDYLGGKSDAR